VEEEFSCGKEEDEDEEEGGPAATRTASGISVGMKGGENGGGITLVSFREEIFDGEM
jgi:hypothetical protein